MTPNKQEYLSFKASADCFVFSSDPDGDYVAFSTDEELCEALGFVSDGVLKVYVRINGKIQKYILQTRQDMISWKQKQTNKRKTKLLIIKDNYILLNQDPR